ncbi:MAG: hypothetical protein CL435_03820 [Acidimicrobiaceae bacterium]|jgi:hypothetical protein|nr:hypothetical protein [Acidimicrobiaceae bacterium]|tara:strand:+ start:97 stop:387 length:291 start_codon:yes stop_codon:yes gene_type:complete
MQFQEVSFACLQCPEVEESSVPFGTQEDRGVEESAYQRRRVVESNQEEVAAFPDRHVLPDLAPKENHHAEPVPQTPQLMPLVPHPVLAVQMTRWRR